MRALEVVCLVHPHCTERGALGVDGDVDDEETVSDADVDQTANGFWSEHMHACKFQLVACLECARPVARGEWAHHCQHAHAPPVPLPSSSSGNNGSGSDAPDELEARAIAAAAAIDSLPESAFSSSSATGAEQASSAASSAAVLLACECGTVVARGALRAHVAERACIAVCVRCPFAQDGCSGALLLLFPPHAMSEFCIV